jgi:hypothetical protein
MEIFSMAKSSRQTPKNPIPISNATALEDPPADIGANQTDQTPPRNEQPAESPAKPTPKAPTFFETMKSIPKEDWGPRANIYLYRVEPIIDRTRSGEAKYIMSYAEPINEDRILADHGSGRYKAMLNFRKPAANTGDVLDSHYFDIFNMKFPPKIPLGEWTDDPRNKRWGWAKEQQTTTTVAPPPAPPADPVAYFGTFMDIQDRIEQRVKPDKEGAPVQTTDPWDAAEKILKMRTENPMVDILRDELKAQREETARMRESIEKQRDREMDDLRKKIDTPAQAASAPKGLIEQLIDFGGDSIKSRIVDSLFGGKAAAAGETVRVGKTGWLDIIDNNAGKLFDMLTPLAQAAAVKMQTPANGNHNGAPPMQTNIAPAPQPNTDQQYAQFIEQVATPKMLTFFAADPSEEGGMAFADWVYAGFPEYFERLQKFSHPRIPGMVGQQAIITAFRYTPSVWSQIGPRELQFTAFIKGFCEFDPNETEEGDDKPKKTAGNIVHDAEFIDLDDSNGRVS